MILQSEVLGVSLEFHGLFSNTICFLYFYVVQAIIFASVMCLMQLFILVIFFADGLVEEMIKYFARMGKNVLSVYETETFSLVWMDQFTKIVHFFKEFKRIYDKITCFDRVFERRFNF